MSKEYSDQDYYWEKAEFQDPVSHRQHVENYKKGIRSSIAFDEEYMLEAMEENYILDPCWEIRADGSLRLREVSIIPNPMKGE